MNSLYSRKIVSGVQCSSCNRGRIGSARTRKMVIKIEKQQTTTSYLFITNFTNLHKLYTTFGKRALVAILSNTPTTSSARTPRVTRTKKILYWPPWLNNSTKKPRRIRTAKNKNKNSHKEAQLFTI